MPCLSSSGSVQVLPAAAGPLADTEGMDDVAAYLSRNGLAVMTHRADCDDAGAGGAILDFVSRETRTFW